MSSTLAVQVSHRFSAAAERVFDAWITPSQASRFFFATRTGNIMRCQIDARVGGHFLVTDRRPQADGEESVMDADHRGEFIEIDRPRRLAFDFSVPQFTDAASRVTIEITPLAATACELVLTHEMPDSEIARHYEEQTRTGWQRMLATLERELFPKRVGI
ncbi:MAG TPA: SRPBCC domain-containing protein [Ramlibacter sp.]|uniref:SRPBCC family protein n=1 Tax=Ramlibacter sp. TaxID=1917967 RepID=UPI002BC266CB|nr:SRPBCC domain-containing protein [Ramlibacter sp.]HVZ46916.1 SRPBCC domain-containing protein [Ramlibacter sp.]